MWKEHRVAILIGGLAIAATLFAVFLSNPIDQVVSNVRKLADSIFAVLSSPAAERLGLFSSGALFGGWLVVLKRRFCHRQNDLAVDNEPEIEEPARARRGEPFPNVSISNLFLWIVNRGVRNDAEIVLLENDRAKEVGLAIRDRAMAGQLGTAAKESATNY